MDADGENTLDQIAIRTARREDASCLVGYMAQVTVESEFLTHDPADPPLSAAQLMSTIEEASGRSNQLVLVAETSSAIVGLLRFRGGTTLRTRHAGELGLTVLKRHWGRGVAADLLERFLSWACRNGEVRQVNLRVRPDNTRALGLYRRYGFVETGRIQRDICIEGRFHDHLIMGLAIDPPAASRPEARGGIAAMTPFADQRSIGPFTYLASPREMAPWRPSLLFLHGSGHSAAFWEHQLGPLNTVANCLALDLPGHGRNAAPVCTTVAQHAETVMAFLDRLTAQSQSATPVIPVGLSLGGAIVLWLLRHHPDRCQAGVIVNSGARLRVTPAIFEALDRGYAQYHELFKRMALTPAHQNDAAIDAALARCATPDTAVTAADYGCCHQFDLMPELARIDRPVLIVAAADDKLTPTKYADFMAAGIPGARCVTLDGAGHLSPLERPAAFNAAVATFVEALPHNSVRNAL